MHIQCHSYLHIKYIYIYEFSIYTCNIHICIACTHSILYGHFIPLVVVSRLSVCELSRLSLLFYFFIFNELALTNVIEHDDDERSEKKKSKREKSSMQNSPHIDLTANRALRVVPIDNHRQRYCLISY